MPGTAADWFGASDEHVRWMRLALAEAERALEHGDVPVGALVFHDGVLIAFVPQRARVDR